jgi:alpha-L-fucosidase
MKADTAWFSEARFGMFIHWGLYSIPAGVWKGVRSGRNWYAEWIQMQGNWPHGIPAEDYRALLPLFNPARFDADAWISEAANAGMRYLVFTTKHHDGFALWPSRVSDFNVVAATPFKRDVVGELAAACRRRGLRVGFYYSHWQDWEHPGGARPKEENPAEPTLLRRQPSQDAFERYWTEKCLPQVAELIEGYRPDLFWFDNWRAAEHLTPERIERLIALVRARAPDCLINSRIGTTWNHPRGDEMVDYLSMNDNHFPEETIARPWETSGTTNRSWGCHQLDFAWKPTGQLLRHLVDNASRGGNFQLNIGPLGDGSFPPPAVRRLREIGAWLAVNGEAVQGTQPGLLPTPDWGRITRRTLSDGTARFYLHVYDWRGGQDLPALPRTGRGAVCRVLETQQDVATRRTADGIVVTLPEERADDRVTVLMLDLSP